MKKNEKFTEKQICEMFGYNKQSLKTNFHRTAKAIEKKYGVALIKCKSIDQDFYIIDEGQRALTIYEQENDRKLDIPIEALSFQAYQFFIFLAITAAQFGVYRGKREDLLKYVGIKPQKKNLQILNSVIEDLVKRKFIGMDIDQDYIILYLRAGIEQQYSVSVKMLRQCQRIANENKKQFNKIAQLLQVWEAVKICEKNEFFTYQDLTELTGLSYKQIRDVKKLLEENNIFRTYRVGSYKMRIGSRAEMNGYFYY